MVVAVCRGVCHYEENPMNTKAVPVLAGASAALVGVLALAGNAAFAQDDRLPRGVTLLGADDTGCNGDLMLESGVRGRDAATRRIRVGQYAVFEVQDSNIGWMCLGERSTSSDTMECPDGTTHLRITRRGDDDVVLFECYGRDG
jgi:hypothetical protein